MSALDKVVDVLKGVEDNSAFFNTDESPFKLKFVPSAKPSNICLVLGDNATGKSLFVEIARNRASINHEIKNICVSIRERTGSGTFEMASFRRSMMFGEEHEQSTGSTSIGVLVNALNQAKEFEEYKLLVLDEPEIGLSISYSEALAQLIVDNANQAENAFLLVVTHRKESVKKFLELCDGNVHAALLGGVQSIDDWLDSKSQKSLDELLALKGQGLEGWRYVHKVTSKRK